MEPGCDAPPPPFLQPKRTPLGLGAMPTQIVISPPVLEKPVSIGASLAHFVDSVEVTRQAGMQSDIRRLHQLAEAMSLLHVDTLKNLQETARALQKKETWTYWQNIAYGLSAATAIILGIDLIAIGQGAPLIAGLFLVGSGALTAVTVASPEKHALALASASLSLVTTYGIAPMLDPASTFRLVVAISETALTLAHGGTTYQVANSDAHRLKLAQELEALHYALGLGEFNTEELLQAQNHATVQLTVAKQAQEAAQIYLQTVSRIVRG